MVSDDRLRALARKIAERELCSDRPRKDACELQSGPYCGTHDWWSDEADLRDEARAALADELSRPPAAEPPTTSSLLTSLRWLYENMGDSPKSFYARVGQLLNDWSAASPALAAPPQMSEHHVQAAARAKAMFVPMLYKVHESDDLSMRMLKKIYNVAAMVKHRDGIIMADELRSIHSAAFAGIDGPEPDYGENPVRTPDVGQTLLKPVASAPAEDGNPPQDVWEPLTERYWIVKMWNAFQELKRLGWNDAMYCPKDGTHFDVIEAGSTGIHDANYEGKWPTGSWWIYDGDISPSRPILFRLRPSPPAASKERT